jgi:hypothetical protein
MMEGRQCPACNYPVSWRTGWPGEYRSNRISKEILMKRLIVAGIASLASLAWAADVPKDGGKDSKPVGLGDKETSIPFLSQRDSILTWEADGQTGLWIQDARKNWYYATFFSPCNGIEFAPQLAFKAKTLNQLDRYSEVVVPNNASCSLRSLRSSGPPPHTGKSKAKSAPAGK